MNLKIKQSDSNEQMSKNLMDFGLLIRKYIKEITSKR